MKELVPALRQYRHNSETGFVFGYDKDETEQIVDSLRREIVRLTADRGDYDNILCVDCLDSGWDEEKEGRSPCACVSETEPYQILEAELSDTIFNYESMSEACKANAIKTEKARAEVKQLTRELGIADWTNGLLEKQIKDIEAQRDSYRDLYQAAKAVSFGNKYGGQNIGKTALFKARENSSANAGAKDD